MKRKISTYQVAFLGMMLAVALVLSFFESTLCAFLALPPGIKLGLANLATMYTLFFAGNVPAVILVLLKSTFVGLTRGFTGFFLSLSGGLMSILVLMLLKRFRNFGFSYVGISVIGAIFHNIGQILAASVLIRSVFTLYYSIVLMLSGAVMGILTGITFGQLVPHFNKLSNKYK
ncbi:Gx transporter family protein [Hydrogenoanaerobacterium sp.]|uniref:Gx transporter family protein n=1 Tax=Hydrogenoanaerobacterium sp. TaxID=2953763 RepID=UPI00289A181B|nr:Gx transporter family protein [Hydrogenoanaerobacterium sp.]